MYGILSFMQPCCLYRVFMDPFSDMQINALLANCFCAQVHLRRHGCV